MPDNDANFEMSGSTLKVGLVKAPLGKHFANKHSVLITWHSRKLKVAILRKNKVWGWERCAIKCWALVSWTDGRAFIELVSHTEHGDNSSYLTFRGTQLVLFLPHSSTSWTTTGWEGWASPPQPVWENEDATFKTQRQEQTLPYNTRLQDSSSWRLAVTIITFCNKVGVGK